VSFDYMILDADNHYSEPDDAYTRYLDPKFRDRGIRIERQDDGSSLNFFGDQPLYFMPFSPAFAGKPGSVVAKKDHRYEPLPPEDLIPRDELPASANRDHRLAWMDEQGIEAVLLWPSFGLTVEYQMRSDPEACIASLKAFNRWLDDDWGLNYQGRLKGAPVVTLLDLDEAITELDYLLDRGASVVSLLFSPVNGRSLAHPDFDPFWARVQEAGIPVAFHGSESGYNEMFSSQFGELPRPPFNAQSPFQRACFFGERPIMDTLASLILHNLFGRFPGIQVLSIENGSAWVPYLLRVMEKGAISGKYGNMLGGPLTDTPTALFKRHISVAPFDDDDIRELIDHIGADRVLLGSDFPHPEGLVEPRAFLTSANLSEQEMQLIGRDNLEKVLAGTLSART
jgi:predicted TIM-barrel fold metal-dependent hydrolase